jgi:hypothetical protein
VLVVPRGMRFSRGLVSVTLSIVYDTAVYRNSVTGLVPFPNTVRLNFVQIHDFPYVQGRGCPAGWDRVGYRVAGGWDRGWVPPKA